MTESEDKYRVIVENAGEAVLVVQDKLYKFVNRKAFDIFGYTPEEMMGNSFSDYLHPDDRKAVIERHLNRLKGKTVPSVYSFRIVDKDGKEKWVEINAVVGEWEGRPATINFLSDITERRHEQKQLFDERNFSEKVINSLPSIFYMFRDDGKMVRWNQRFQNYSGFSPEEIAEKKAIDFIPEEYKKVTLKAIQKVFAKGEASIESQIMTKSGEKIPFFYTGKRIDLGDESFLVGSGIDISERKRTEQALRESEEKYRILVEESPLGVSMIGKNGRYKYINPKFTEIFGYTLEDIPSGREWFRNAYPDEKIRKRAIARWKDDQTKYAVGEPQIRTYTVSCRDGSEKTIEFRQVNMVTGDQLVTYEDVTETRRLEEQFRQAQKMEAIGTLAGGISHDFNNFLQGFLSYIQILMLTKKEDDPELKKLQDMKRVADRASELTQQLLTFSRKVESDLRPVDLNAEVLEIEKLIRRTIPRMIEIELNLGNDIKVINADPVQVEQLIMNLGVNARDAMPEGGSLIIETENVTLDEKYAKTHLGAVPGEYVLLTISDTGHGIDRETLKHIFEPFYTTKGTGTGTGTGLGLAMVYGTVKSHGGYIMCYSEPGEGTTFKIYFPAIEAESPDQKAVRVTEETLPHGSETILLVDDEDFLRELGKEMLERFGYKVWVADTGENAIEMYTGNTEEISLVILDLVMPGMGGQKCFEEILKINPLQKVIIASGYPVNSQTKKAIDIGAKGYIKKPYELKTLLTAVRGVLDKN